MQWHICRILSTGKTSVHLSRNHRVVNPAVSPWKFFQISCVAIAVKNMPRCRRRKNWDASSNQSNNFGISHKRFKPSTPGSIQCTTYWPSVMENQTLSYPGPHIAASNFIPADKVYNRSYGNSKFGRLGSCVWSWVCKGSFCCISWGVTKHHSMRTATKYMLGFQLNKQETLNTSNGVKWWNDEGANRPVARRSRY